MRTKTPDPRVNAGPLHGFAAQESLKLQSSAIRQKNHLRRSLEADRSKSLPVQLGPVLASKFPTARRKLETKTGTATARQPTSLAHLPLAVYTTLTKTQLRQAKRPAGLGQFMVKGEVAT